MTAFVTYATALVYILVMMTILWAISLALRNSSIVDIFWGMGFVFANAVFFVLAPEGYLPRKWLVTALVTLWGLRLSIHILRRNWGKGEDPRYRQWREEAGKRWWWISYFKVFFLQGIILWAVSAPLLVAQVSQVPRQLTFLDFVGLLFWVTGFFFETVGDWQLAKFKKDPQNRGKVLSTGLWRYTRHPNYFGDALLWWGFFLFALATPGGLWTVFSPILMTILLLRVSGVALLEKSLAQTRPEYQKYIETTSAFVPWFPRKKG